MTLEQTGEDKLVREIIAALGRDERLLAAPGDDCAVVRFKHSKNLLVLKSDCVVQDIHFNITDNAAAIGWKAMMRTLSDFAAISGVPEFALITLVISPSQKLSWVRDLYRGLKRAASLFDVAIVGGETSGSKNVTTVVVSAAGYVERHRCILRSGGKRRDQLFVTGLLGGSDAGRHLRFVPRITESRWLTAHFHVHAMIDLSDGLGCDLPRLARASGLGFRIDERALPLRGGCTSFKAITAGEDYELLFAVAANESRTLVSRWRKKFPRLRLTQIGELTSRSESSSAELPAGYVHFLQRG